MARAKIVFLLFNNPKYEVGVEFVLYCKGIHGWNAPSVSFGVLKVYVLYNVTRTQNNAAVSFMFSVAAGEIFPAVGIQLNSRHMGTRSRFGINTKRV